MYISILLKFHEWNGIPSPLLPEAVALALLLEFLCILTARVVCACKHDEKHLKNNGGSLCAPVT